jgi:alkylhydroperoxidase family enzyme
MPRLREVPRAEADEKVALPLYAQLFGSRDPVSEPGTATGTRGDWWTVFANSPDTLRHAAQGFAYYRSSNRKLDPVLRELGQTWAGWACASQFVFSQHCKSLRGLGVSEAKIAALPAWQTSDVFDAKERLVLAYADRLVCHQGRVPDALFAELKAVFSDEEILELTYITCLYHMERS